MQVGPPRLDGRTFGNVKENLAKKASAQKANAREAHRLELTRPALSSAIGPTARAAKPRAVREIGAEVSGHNKKLRVPTVQESDPGAAAAFLQVLFASSDLVRIRLIESWTEAGSRRSRFVASRCVSAEEARKPEFLQELFTEANQNRANVYFGVCPRFGAEGFDHGWQIRTARVLWCDLDQCSVRDALQRCRETGLPDPTVVVESGYGVHLYWKLRQLYGIDDIGAPPRVVTESVSLHGKRRPIQSFIDPATGSKVFLHDPQTGSPLPKTQPTLTARANRFQETIKGISLLIDGDRNAHDPARLLRLPGTMNRKDERNGVSPRLCRVTNIQAEKQYSLLDFEAIIRSVRTDESNKNATVPTTPAVRVIASPGQPTENPTNPVERLPDAEVIRRARSASNWDKFEQLWDGDHSEYKSRSEADLALCALLAFWTGPNREQIRRLFLRSGLCREKSARSTYLEQTINKALEGRTEFYTPFPSLDRTSSVEVVRIDNFDGGAKDVAPRVMSDILAQIRTATGGWPRRIGERLFAESSDGVAWIDKSASLFGFLGSASGVPPRFVIKPGFHTKEEVFHELKRHAESYRGVELIPHEPLIEGVYYACRSLPASNGSALEGLIDRFSLSTPQDRHILKAALASCFWGGPCGSRPAFVIAARGGRGRGKTTIAKAVGRLCGGHLALEKGEDIEKFKTRLLSPAGLSKRIVILDNLKSMKFSWAEVESMITASEISGRALYVGEHQRPNTLMWFFTVNGANFSTDIAKRCVSIELADPEYQASWEEETFRYVEEHRDAIIADALTFLRSPSSSLENYSRWGAWEKAVLSKLPDPDALQKLILERQVGTDVEAEEAELFENHIRDKLEQISLSPETSRVFIPSRVAARLFAEAMNDRHAETSTVSRWVKQKIDERRFTCLKQNRSNRHGRGFLWIGPQRDESVPLVTDLEDRLNRQLPRRF